MNGVSERSTRKIDVVADEAQVLVAHQHAGQQPRLAQDLEAVADAEHQPAFGGMPRTASMIGARAAMAPQRR